MRARQKRNLLATLLLSQGVPMLLAGDENGRTQQGNNNAYCQDNEIELDRLDADAGARGAAGLRAPAHRAAPAITRRSAGAISSRAGRSTARA